MKITNILTIKEINDIKKLNILCDIERVPNFDSSIYIDPDLPCFYLEYKDNKLICFLLLFYVSRESIEVIGATHPSYREKGYFTSLLNEAKKVIPKNLSILFQIPSNLVDKEKLEVKGFHFHHGEDELISIIEDNNSQNLISLGPQDIDAVANLLADSFNRGVEEEIELLNLWILDKSLFPLVLKEANEVIGFIVISKTFDVKTSYLFAFCVDKKHRSKGYGEKILSNLPLNSNGYVLRVNYNNARAKKFYKRIGFNHLSSTEYFSKK